MNIGDNLIFGRYTREECGLPPVEQLRPRRGSLVLRVLLLFAVLVTAGWLGGVVTARVREAWMSTLPGQVYLADPQKASELLAQGRMYATALPDRPGMRRDLALAGLIAAERAPRRLGYYGNLRALFDGQADGSTDSAEGDFMFRVTAAGVFAELGEYKKAFADLDRAEEALERIEPEGKRSSYRLHLVNAQAYFLAVAPESEGGDPERALRLAQLMITSRDSLVGGGKTSASPELMDTLAAAWYAMGNAERALAAQTYALGLATSGLDVYVRHYDEFAGGESR